MAQQARAIETRDRILHGAADVFAETGYEGASINDILKAAGVTRGALYFHFESKEDLGRTILVLQTNWLETVTFDPTTSGAQQLVDLGNTFAQALQHDKLVRASVRMTTEGHGFDAEQRAAFDAWLRTVKMLATGAVADGSVQPTWTTDAVAATLTACANGIQLSSLIYSNYVDMTDRLRSFWTMIGPNLFTSDAFAALRF
ncbi:TetR/AcrR family transcriptional regulator [Yimella sp. RIT 621]|uniref:ScbR family autoregulator-binding transcription factor n=1 Tax=Yimella sp. RIT 621 TaxID=2510323 RepID=UPI00101BD7FE|nr:ScbR family autoregulator-binding transcription factor [Yimella sp. RIT 621]RYG78661.1 TetR/AcrR family transcriptional regulator [Yimella sp. RIT 621]